jgi:hypothetical protein
MEPNARILFLLGTEGQVYTLPFSKINNLHTLFILLFKDVQFWKQKKRWIILLINWIFNDALSNAWRRMLG